MGNLRITNKRSVGRALNRLLRVFGLRIYRIRSIPGEALEFDPVFARLTRLGVQVGSIIDIGASDGSWSERAKAHYPDAACHMVEANRVHQKGLEAFVRRYPGSSYTLAAAADRVGKVYFDDRDPWSGAASREAQTAGQAQVDCTSIDEEVQRLALRGPFLIKLDTHGFEVPIIEGASATLPETSVIVVETYNFHLRGDSKTFWEICEYLVQKGFRPFDLLDPVHRPKDGAFWQVDIVFLRNGHQVFEDNQFT